MCVGEGLASPCSAPEEEVTMRSPFLGDGDGATAPLWGQRTNRLRGILSCERFATSLFGKTSLFDSLTREF